MKPILVVYASREGQTLRVAGHIASTLGGRGHAVECINVADLTWKLDWSSYSACILAASVHGGRHEPDMCRFVQQHRRDLNALPTAFVSTSLSEAAAENPALTAPARKAAAERVHAALEAFFDQTEWRPDRTKPVAGALRYGQYGWVMRLVMRSIARTQGLDTDTSHDHQYTDWSELERFVIDFASGLGRSPS